MQKNLFQSLHRLLGQWRNKRITQMLLSYYFFKYMQAFKQIKTPPFERGFGW
jgi:hypothetical protein